MTPAPTLTLTRRETRRQPHVSPPDVTIRYNYPMRHIISVVVLAGAVLLMFMRRDTPRGIPAGDTPPTPRAAACDARVQRTAPCFTPFDVKPQLRNAKSVQASLARNYPQQGSGRRIEGTAHVFVLIDDVGAVRNVLIGRSSGVAVLDTAALRVAHDMEFWPAHNNERATWVWFEVPITFRAP